MSKSGKIELFIDQFWFIHTAMSHNLFNVRIDDYTEVEVFDMVRKWLVGNQPRMIVTPNAEFLLKARSNESFRNLLSSSDLSVADGVAIRFGIAALQNEKLINRITGVDLVQHIARICNEEKKSLMLLGGAPMAAELASEILIKRFPDLKVTSFDPGHIEYKNGKFSVPDALKDELQNKPPDAIAVALGQGKQEVCMNEIRKLGYNVKVMIGIGGALDMISGMKRRSPQWMSRIGLEWVWRLLIEPKRAKRILKATIVFPCVVALETIKQGKFFKACRNVFPEVFRQLRGL